MSEALTNLVWAPLAEGLDSVSLSANWMWPCRSQEGEDARLYTAVKALSDFCCALQINVPTGKDSLSMTQKYPDGSKVIAPGTVIVSAGGEVSDVKKVVSPVLVNDHKTTLYHIDFSFDNLKLGGSAFSQSLGKVGDDVPTVQNPEYFRDAFLAVQELVNKGSGAGKQGPHPGRTRHLGRRSHHHPARDVLLERGGRYGNQPRQD